MLKIDIKPRKYFRDIQEVTEWGKSQFTGIFGLKMRPYNDFITDLFGTWINGPQSLFSIFSEYDDTGELRYFVSFYSDPVLKEDVDAAFNKLKPKPLKGFKLKIIQYLEKHPGEHLNMRHITSHIVCNSSQRAAVLYALHDLVSKGLITLTYKDGVKFYVLDK